MRIGYKILTGFVSLIAFLSLLLVATAGLAENFPGGYGGP